MQPACIIHCRVSTPKQAYEGESLDVQASVCSEIAANNNWVLAHEPWKESFSGRKTSRPIFDEILAFLDAHPSQVQYYLFRSIDRATRGGSFSYEQIKRALQARGVAMVDSYGIIQPAKNTLHDVGFEYDWSMVSPSEIAEVVLATSAKADVSNILTRLIGQEIRLRQRGYKVRGPVDGFVNTRIIVDGKRRVIEKPDPERALFFVTMFQLRAAGQLSDAEICAQVNALGYRSRILNRWDATHQTIIGISGGNPLTPKRLQEIVRRPIYCGVICEKWTRWKPIKAAYDGLVSLDTFNAANRGKIAIEVRHPNTYRLSSDVPSRTPKLSRDNPMFPLRRVVRCPLCNRPFLGSAPRGRDGTHYPTYHCGRGHKYLGIPKARFEDTVRRFIRTLHFRSDDIALFHGVLAQLYRAQAQANDEREKQAADNVAKLEEQKMQAVRAFRLATSDAMRAGLEAELAALEERSGQPQKPTNNLRISESDIDDFVQNVRQVMEHPACLLSEQANARQLETLYDATFEGWPTYSKIADGTAQLAWIFEIFLESVDTESALVRLHALDWNQIEKTILKWKDARDSLQLLLHHASSKRQCAKRPPQRP